MTTLFGLGIATQHIFGRQVRQRMKLLLLPCCLPMAFPYSRLPMITQAAFPHLQSHGKGQHFDEKHNCSGRNTLSGKAHAMGDHLL